MARELWFDPNNPSQFVIRDNRLGPAPPAGYVQAETADGGRGGQPLAPGSVVYGQQQQTYTGGMSSGGYPAYGATGKYPNGLVGA